MTPAPALSPKDRSIERNLVITPTRLAALGVATLLALAGCTTTAPQAAAPSAASGQPAASYPLAVTDCGKEVTFQAAPTKVMTIGSDAIALLDAAGAADRIIARSGEFGAELPAGLTHPPTDATIVDPSDPTTEKILGSGAETVIGYGFFKADAKALADAGITLLTISGECGHDANAEVKPVDFDLILGDVSRFGRVFGTVEVADRAVNALSSRIKAVRDAKPTATRSAAAVYYFSSTAPMSAYGGAGILHTQLAMNGLTNAYGDQPKTYLEVSTESLLKADPEVIVLAYGLFGETFETAKKRLLAEPGAKDLRAVKAGRIIPLRANQTSASTAAVDGLEALHKAVAGLGS